MESDPVPRVVEDCFGILKLYSDGSIYRSEKVEHLRASFPDDGSAIWKDYFFDVENNLSLRIYKPKHLTLSADQKLPILLYLRAGGFCFTSHTFHNNCISLCSGLPALVVSPEYRLAPENRLPAALDDSQATVRWLREQAWLSERKDCNEWFGDMVNFDRVFVVGDSSGGTMAHHLAVRFGTGSPEISPVRIRGYVLMSPFFGGTKRTRSEEERPRETVWSLEIYDRLFRLALPEGANADSPFVNPCGPLSPSVEEVSLDPILVLVGGAEILRDRAQDYARRLEEFNKKVKYVEFEGKEHGFFASNPFGEEAKDLIRVIKDFISEI